MRTASTSPAPLLVARAPDPGPGDVLASVAKSRRTLLAVMSRACPSHGAAPGLPCWTVEREYGQVSYAVCDYRIDLWRHRVVETLKKRAAAIATTNAAVAPARTAPSQQQGRRRP